MYERELRYDKIIGCYLRDPVRKVSNFLLRSSAASPAGNGVKECNSPALLS